MYSWTTRLRPIHDQAVAQYRAGRRGADTFFDAGQTEFLASIGLRPIHVYDYAEDFVSGGDPDGDTFLLVASARRDYFLHELHGEPAAREIPESELPLREEELDGIPWLPRIIAKARCFLEGSLARDVMYDCGGDRRFLRQFDRHPADFLRATWAARGDDRRILAFLRGAAG